jgi:GTP-binding protein
LGVLKNSSKNILVADMPGIIEGAHLGKGLGLRFLRHIERTHLVILVIDIAGDRPCDQYYALLDEFSNYSDALMKKPRLVVFNKIDLVDTIPTFTLKERMFYVSAITGQGVKELARFLANEDKI